MYNLFHFLKEQKKPTRTGVSKIVRSVLSKLYFNKQDLILFSCLEVHSMPGSFFVGIFLQAKKKTHKKSIHQQRRHMSAVPKNGCSIGVGSLRSATVFFPRLPATHSDIFACCHTSNNVYTYLQYDTLKKASLSVVREGKV